MQAMVINETGGPSAFRRAEVETPQVILGHVLIRVSASSVNPLDCTIRSRGLGLCPEFPAVLHGDVAGVVEQVGSEVAGFRVGDEVYGYAGGLVGTGGALAEFMLADARLLARKPKGLSMEEAAALPLVPPREK